MTFNKEISETNIRIGEVRFSYANVFAPREQPNGGDPKYSVCVLIPKKDAKTVELVKEAIEAAKAKGKAEKWGGKVPGKLTMPLRDGDNEKPDDPTYEDMWFFNCSSKNKPGVKVLENGSVEDALDGEDFYSGCFGAVTVNFYPYDTSGNKGVGAGLNNLIKTRDGTRLSGGRTADEDFGDLGDDSLN